jgi:peptide/nickel transport system permease protein
MEDAKEKTGLGAWLTTHSVRSPFQAWSQRVYYGGKEFAGQPLAMFGFIVITLLLAVAMAAPLLAPYDPLQQDLANRLLPPGGEHLLGTDELGRDLLSRVIYGSRISLYIIMLVTVILAPIGLTIGVVSGYFGGKIDTFLMRITDVFLAFPGLVLALAFVATLGPSLDNAIIAIALTGWPGLARLARAETMVFRSQDYFSVVRLQGGSHARVIFLNLMPLCLPSVIVRITLSMSSILLTAAGLGFLGLGAQPPTPEWGAMLSTGRRFMLDCWWLVTMPGCTILIVSLAFNLLGDGLRDILDPRSEQK